MNQSRLAVVMGFALVVVGTTAAAQTPGYELETSAQQGTPVAEVDQDGRTAVVVQYPTGTPFSRFAGTGGFSDAAPNARRMFQALDDDQSGALEPAEVPLVITLGDRFAAYDINGDGVIAKNEFQSYFAAQRWLQGDEQLPWYDRERIAADGDAGLNVDVVEVDPDQE